MNELGAWIYFVVCAIIFTIFILVILLAFFRHIGEDIFPLSWMGGVTASIFFLMATASGMFGTHEVYSEQPISGMKIEMASSGTLSHGYGSINADATMIYAADGQISNVSVKGVQVIENAGADKIVWHDGCRQNNDNLEWFVGCKSDDRTVERIELKGSLSEVLLQKSE